MFFIQSRDPLYLQIPPLPFPPFLSIQTHPNYFWDAVAGVQEKRLSEGLLPRHCALSLVGEPIMYPEINSLVDELHRRRISTFLVTNAQFPEKIKMLKPITQVYMFLLDDIFDNRNCVSPIFLFGHILKLNSEYKTFSDACSYMWVLMLQQKRV